MARYVDGVDIEKVYTIHEIMEMYEAGRLRRVAIQGYVVRADAERIVVTARPGVGIARAAVTHATLRPDALRSRALARCYFFRADSGE